MKIFEKLRIRTSLLISFVVVIMFSVILTVMGILTIMSETNNYDYILSTPMKQIENLEAVKREFMTMRYRAANFVMNSGDLDFINNTAFPQYEAARDSILSNLDECVRLNNDDAKRDPGAVQNLNEAAQTFKGLFQEYEQYGNKSLEFARADDMKAADGELKEAIPTTNKINALLEDMITPVNAYIDDTIVSMTKSEEMAMLSLAGLAVILVLISVALAISLGKFVSKSIVGLGKAAKEIANGNLNINLASNAKNEIGDLARDLGIVAGSINDLIAELNNLATGFVAGDIKSEIDIAKFNGAYKEVADSINTLRKSQTADTLKLLDCMKDFGDGDFSADIEKMPGQKVIMNNTLDTLRDNLQSIGKEINTLVNDAIQGKLGSHADVKKYKGDWAEILNGLNRLLEAIAAPINEAESVLQQVSEGNFDSKVEGNYQGDFLVVKDSINSTVTNVASYIDEISKVLTALSQGDLNQSINREYVGEFSHIKEALNNIIDKLNSVISDILAAADQVAGAARQVSESSMVLAQGATEQASAIEELNATILTINENTSQNAKSAKEAENLSNDSKNNAAEGDRDMNNMLTSMESIKESSNSISKIISVIDNIAFQTNLLALNAAVEAARAGEHGKGFAVVAEEVRSLAGRSQDAAKETTQLIQESIDRISEGTKIAGTTSDALQTIVGDVSAVANLITDIAEASEEQTVAINQVTEGLSQITAVVQNNSATSEESASASQQLSSQAEMLQSLVSVFNLKKDFGK